MNWYTDTNTKDAAPYAQGQVYDKAGRTVAITYDVNDAPLVAAAPDMLQALKQIIRLTQTNNSPDWRQWEKSETLAAEIRQIAKSVISRHDLGEVEK